MGRLFSLGKASIELRCAEHHLRRLADDGAIPCQRCGWYRLFAEKDFPKIRTALIEAGYVKPGAAQVVHA